MTSQSIIQGIVLLLYLIAMVMVGFVFYKKIQHIPIMYLADAV